MFQLIATLCAVVLVAVDQWIKNWAVTTLATGGDITLIDGALYLHYVENTGAAFSIFQGQRLPLVVITSVLILEVLGAFLSGKVTNKLYIATLSLIMAGGVGNLIDRIAHGFVVDYVDFRLINFAVFNLADACITVGTVLLCGAIIYTDAKKSRIEKLEKESEDEPAETKEQPNE